MSDFIEAVAFFMRENADLYIDASKRAHRAMDPSPFPDFPFGCTCGRGYATRSGRSQHTSKQSRKTP